LREAAAVRDSNPHEPREHSGFREMARAVATVRETDWQVVVRIVLEIVP